MWIDIDFNKWLPCVVLLLNCCVFDDYHDVILMYKMHNVSNFHVFWCHCVNNMQLTMPVEYENFQWFFIQWYQTSLHVLLFVALQSSQARISALYLPLLTIVIENKTRLQRKEAAPPAPGLAVNGETLTDMASRRSSTLGSYNSQISLDQASLASGLSSVSQQRPTVRDPNVFSLISGQG